mmetsp:Transcript_12945/g.37664  ORF Transcript_12945/g.37664 Transcript_12945/m.37664 type:complete len:212 (-) Transcript_12945:68-703(-)
MAVEASADSHPPGNMVHRVPAQPGEQTDGTNAQKIEAMKVEYIPDMMGQVTMHRLERTDTAPTGTAVATATTNRSVNSHLANFLARAGLPPAGPAERRRTPPTNQGRSSKRTRRRRRAPACASTQSRALSNTSTSSSTAVIIGWVEVIGRQGRQLIRHVPSERTVTPMTPDPMGLLRRINLPTRALDIPQRTKATLTGPFRRHRHHARHLR